MDKGGRPHSMTTLIRRQENLALKLLDEALDPKVTVDIRLDVFDRVSRYLAVKNRITDAEETDIDRFKARIHGPQAQTPQGRRAPRETVAGPKDLAGIKSKLSGGDGPGSSRDSDGTGGSSIASS